MLEPDWSIRKAVWDHRRPGVSSLFYRSDAWRFWVREIPHSEGRFGENPPPPEGVDLRERLSLLDPFDQESQGNSEVVDRVWLGQEVGRVIQIVEASFARLGVYTRLEKHRNLGLVLLAVGFQTLPGKVDGTDIDDDPVRRIHRQEVDGLIEARRLDDIGSPRCHPPDQGRKNAASVEHKKSHNRMHSNAIGRCKERSTELAAMPFAGRLAFGPVSGRVAIELLEPIPELISGNSQELGRSSLIVPGRTHRFLDELMFHFV